MEQELGLAWSWEGRRDAARRGSAADRVTPAVGRVAAAQAAEKGFSVGPSRQLPASEGDQRPEGTVGSKAGHKQRHSVVREMRGAVRQG